jgi:hypothetical protein
VEGEQHPQLTVYVVSLLSECAMHIQCSIEHHSLFCQLFCRGVKCDHLL